jgi:cob(I)alamin adenosyltransferase
LEKWCDEFGADLPNLRSFLLPGGSVASAQLHIARTIVRRAERAAWRAAEEFGLEDGSAEPQGGVNVFAIRYLNRLSDLLFILARHANLGTDNKETLWLPGGERDHA